MLLCVDGISSGLRNIFCCSFWMYDSKPLSETDWVNWVVLPLDELNRQWNFYWEFSIGCQLARNITGILTECSLMLIALAKSLECEGVSHQPAFMGNCRTISHMFYNPIYPVDEGNEKVGSIWDNILLLFYLVWIKLIT